MKRFSIYIAIALAVTACANTQLSPGAASVKIFKNMPISEASKYREIGPVSCSFGSNFKSASTNIIQCRNELRNVAAAQGASVIIIDHQQIGTSGSGFGEYAIAGCPNCVTMVGTAYTDQL